MFGRKHRGIPLIAGLMAASLLVAGCGGDDDTGDTAEATTTTAAPTPEPGGTLAFGISRESNGWQPMNDLWNNTGYVVALTFFDRLTAYDEDGNIRPYLAESVTSNDDFTEWTIKLREGVKFHDGTDLDADALKQNLDAVFASAIWSGQFLTVDSVDVVDDLTVKVSMSEPFSTFAESMSFEPGIVVAPSQLEDPDGARNPVGTGPFIFEEWEQGDHLTVRKNPDYWQEGYPLLDGIEFQVIEDSSARAEALESGDIDIMEVTAAEQVIAFEGDESGEFQLYLDDEGEGTERYVNLNTAIPPFDDPIARQAVAYGIDRAGISESVYGGRFHPANGPFKENSPWYQDVQFPSYDADKASELAAQYEEEHGEPLSFEIQLGADPVELAIAQEIQKSLEDVGITMTISQIEDTTILVNVVAGNYEAQFGNFLWGSQTPDREALTILSDNAHDINVFSTNITRLKSTEIDDAVAAARATDDIAEQIAQWKSVQEVLASETPTIFLVHNDVGEVARTTVRDVTNWTFPDGTQGRPQEQTILSYPQMWLQQ